MSDPPATIGTCPRGIRERGTGRGTGNGGRGTGNGDVRAWPNARIAAGRWSVGSAAAPTHASSAAWPTSRFVGATKEEAPGSIPTAGTALPLPGASITMAVKSRSVRRATARRSAVDAGIEATVFPSDRRSGARLVPTVNRVAGSGDGRTWPAKPDMRSRHRAAVPRIPCPRNGPVLADHRPLRLPDRLPAGRPRSQGRGPWSLAAQSPPPVKLVVAPSVTTPGPQRSGGENGSLPLDFATME